MIAIVDRTANLEEAAEALLTARFSFNGTSPYAPDVVLVNEFVKKDFLNAVIRKSIDFMTGRIGDGVLDEKNSNDRRKQATNDISGIKGVNVITSGSNGTVAEISDRRVEPSGLGDIWQLTNVPGTLKFSRKSSLVARL